MGTHLLQLAALPLGQRSLALSSMGAQKRFPSVQTQRGPLGGRGGALRVAANKGFGKAAQPKKKEEDDVIVPGQRESGAKTVKFKGKRSMRGGPQSQAAQQYTRDAAGAAAQPGFNVLQPGLDGEREDNLVEAIEFEQRLKQLKAESEARKAEEQDRKSVV